MIKFQIKIPLLDISDCLNNNLLHYHVYKKARFLFLSIIFSVFISSVSNAAVCSVNTVAVAFGAYNVYSTSNTLTTGQVTVNCSPAGTAYTVALNGGTFGTIAQRKQGSGLNRLLYNLYTDVSRSTLWGDGSTNGVTVSSSGMTPLNIYGSIPASQDVSVGNYSDSVSVTVTF
jgi:spore coat protein U-like protein